MTEAASWYSDADVAHEYDSARLQRIFFRGWHGILRGVADGLIPKPPLSALFDYLYMRRLVSNARETFRAADILDIGSGTSYIYRHLLAQGWTGRCSGMDISPAMLSVARSELERLRISEPPSPQSVGHLFRYVDRLGRDTIAEVPPSSSLDLDALDWLKEHLQSGSLEAGVDRTYSAITGFSGPLCFYPTETQMTMLARLLMSARDIVTLQFKNARFADFDGGPWTSRALGIVEPILRGRELFPHAALSAWQAENPHECELSPEVEEDHEAGGFPYWRVGLPAIRQVLADCGWAVTGVTSMGLISQSYYPLAAELYSEARGVEAARVLERLRTVDDFFCEQILAGDNLQVTAIPRPGSVDYSPGHCVTRGVSFRDGYRPIHAPS